MLLKIWRLLFGYVEFEIIGRFPERFLNLAYSSGINIWGQIPKNGKIMACMPIRGYRHVRKTAKKAHVRLKITEKHGLPFLIKRHSDRIGLVAGMAVSVILIIFLSNFVWVLNIQTSPSVNYIRIKTALEKNGVGIGAYIKNIDVLSLERRLMQDVPELSWVAVNIVGTTVNIEIKSKEERPDTSSIEKPQNIKASKNGVIVKLEVQNGESVTSVGSGAAKGQLLVSGVTVDALDNISLVHAKARILARTSFQTSFSAPSKSLISVSTGKVFYRNRIKLLWFTSPPTPEILPNSAYFQNFKNYYWNLNENSLPIGYNLEENHEYVPKEIVFTEEQQKKNAYNKMALYEAFFMPKATVENRIITENSSDNGFTLSVKYTCIEDIAESDPIYIDENEETQPEE